VRHLVTTEQEPKTQIGVDVMITTLGVKIGIKKKHYSSSLSKKTLFLSNFMAKIFLKS
jgi:hypothetical protein